MTSKSLSAWIAVLFITGFVGAQACGGSKSGGAGPDAEPIGGVIAPGTTGAAGVAGAGGLAGTGGDVGTGSGTAVMCGDPGTSCCSGNSCKGGGCCVSGICLASGGTCVGLGGGLCSNGACGHCGGPGLPCCSSSLGLVCTSAGTTCSGGTCAKCGDQGAACCASAAGVGTCSSSDLMCSSGICQKCGVPGGPCCAGNTCQNGCCYGGTCIGEATSCGAGNGTCSAGRCTGCGNATQPCCGTLCYDKLMCLGNTCKSCGGPGEGCCPAGGAAPQCQTGLACNGTGAAAVCALCGTLGDACCPGNACSDGCCSAGRCVVGSCPIGTGGSTGTAGATGGTRATGGVVGSGGTVVIGGTTQVGGSVVIGGTLGTGGTTKAGGTTVIGGATKTGGTTGTQGSGGSRTGGTQSTSASSGNPDAIGPSKTCGCLTSSGNYAGNPLTATIVVNNGETYDGGCKTYITKSLSSGGLGDGGQEENQKPLFRVNAGGKLINVILGAPAADGVHFYGNATAQNIHWLDIGEDAATIKEDATVTLDCGSAKNGSDKVFQVNAKATWNISNFTIKGAGKAMRENGDQCYPITAVFDHCDISDLDEVIFRTDCTSSKVSILNTRYSGLGDGLVKIGSTVYNSSSGNITVTNVQKY